MKDEFKLKFKLLEKELNLQIIMNKRGSSLSQFFAVPFRNVFRAEIAETVSSLSAALL